MTRTCARLQRRRTYRLSAWRNCRCRRLSPRWRCRLPRQQSKPSFSAKKTTQRQTLKKSNQTMPQIDRFIETARALECNEDEAEFDEKLKRIALAKPKAKTKAAANARVRRSRKSPD